MLPLSHRINSVNAPTVSYTFNTKDAYMFYCTHDDTMNFIADDESRIEVAGIDAATMFTCARNALCAGDNIIKELQGKSHQLQAARDMIEALQGFIDAYNKED